MLYLLSYWVSLTLYIYGVKKKAYLAWYVKTLKMKFKKANILNLIFS